MQNESGVLDIKPVELVGGHACGQRMEIPGEQHEVIVPLFDNKHECMAGGIPEVKERYDELVYRQRSPEPENGIFFFDLVPTQN